MLLTQELQHRFNDAFYRIMRQTPKELQKRWNGAIEWKDLKSYPDIPPEIIQALPPAAKAAYISLLNKLSRGTI